MGTAGGDFLSDYFEEGARVEISSDEDGFLGSWYAGTVVREAKGESDKVVVQYDSLWEDKSGTVPLIEEMDMVQMRPQPPPEDRTAFKLNESVDAYYNDGWWEGCITQVVGKGRYMVYFRASGEWRNFRASHLRLHREWVYGKWVPPLKESPNVMYSDLKSPVSAKVEMDIDSIEHNFEPGEEVEIGTNEEGLEGALLAATVIKKTNTGKYLIEYKNLRNDDDTDFLREEVDGLHIRPHPPDIGLVDRFTLYEEVDAWYNDAWWFGTISKVLKIDKYTVYFHNSDEELKFRHFNLRVHQEWKDGKWYIGSKALNC